jgi:hypothetical protein
MYSNTPVTSASSYLVILIPSANGTIVTVLATALVHLGRGSLRSALSLPSHHYSPKSPASIHTGSSTSLIHTPPPFPYQNNCRPKKTPLKAPRFVGTLSARGRSWACESSSACTAELRTFYCERVRQMQLSRLNSGMLVGFLCKTEAVWIDFRRQVAELCSLDGRT